MPLHSYGTVAKYDAGSVSLNPTSYVVDDEINGLFKVAAGAVNTEYDISFDYTKVNDYCLSVATQSAAQAVTGARSPAAAGTIVIKTNSTGSPVNTITVVAGTPHAFAPCLFGTANEFTTSAVTKFYLSNAGAADLWLDTHFGINL